MSDHSQTRLDIDPAGFRQSFNREPFGFCHNLNQLDLFKLDSLHGLALKMAAARQDVFIAEGARSAGTRFFSVPMVNYKAHEALENLDNGAFRILLKRPENHDPRFKELIHALFEQMVGLLGGLGKQKVVRLEAGLLISSAATITPFHYDSEIGCFSQIEGEKMYHVFTPTVIREEEVERSCICGPGVLAPLELSGRDKAREHIFQLTAGKGFHQPENSPHWVETGASRSVSYTFVFETDATRAKARTRAFNHYVRKIGVVPPPVGARPLVDALKAETMRAVIPVRQALAKTVNKVRVARQASQIKQRA